ncbi:hypothetical protein BpHYR1_038729 [Brachionus plicatilis]|uniref:Uncharacterized protein n=1 Tax=Brachionus plicatilis TaxID=10195 RepID=A0A3M7SA07_BRAPC|nr:hypothetical protein BpHYR1_038729 [Brachionus plicatilis]
MITNSKHFVLNIWLLLNIFLFSEAQTQCDTICSITPNCNNGVCSISKCSETDGCFQFCLNCAGIESCSQAGSTCSPSASIGGFQLFGTSNIELLINNNF